MRTIPYLAMSVMLLLTLTAFADEPPTAPILKIETGMHIAAITSIGIDKGERFLVTGSLDKTIKVWELRTGRLIKTLRPPIGSGNEGKIYAVAISPDGRHVAAGGWTGWDWGGIASIYIFDLNTGSLVQRCSGLPDVITHLAYSKDGRYLAAGLRENGTRIYKTDDYSLIKQDSDYGDRVFGLDFSDDGRLVTTSLDGYIRLYDKNFKLIRKKKAPGDSNPYQVSFSPDGSRIAIGCADTPSVDILSADDLDKLYSADTEGFSGCDFSSVTFSFDGSFLYAGGGCQKKVDGDWKVIIRRWERAGKGRYIDVPATSNTIMHILPLKDGGVVFGSGAPSFGILDASGRLALYKGNTIADFRGEFDEFQISYDGSVVRFGYEQWGKSIAVFDAERREFVDETSVKLSKPLTQMQGLEITDWKNSYHPKLNGEPIKLEQYETSTSLAIAPDGKRFLLGTEWYLRLFDSNGNEIWEVPVPGVVPAVNISGNGKVAVAGLGDGTIRWFRMEDGKELVAFFPHKDRKRWVIWTPKGYYDASPGGEELIGWHINNGKDREADFFPASRFRDRFYRPDVIAKLFTTFDEAKAIALANEESGRAGEEEDVRKVLPPIVTILSPRDGSFFTKEDISVRFVIRNPSNEPVTGIRVLIDGRPVAPKGIQPEPVDGDIREVTVTVPRRDCELSLIAENRFAASVPSTVRLVWKGEEFILRPKLYVLAIGISNYRRAELRLRFGAKDAKDFAETIKRQKGLLYEDVVVRLLTDEEASRDEILDGLDWLQRQTTAKDMAMVFISGHGENDAAGVYYFLPVDADPEKLKRTCVAYSDVLNTVKGLAGKVVMFIDTCHAGNIMGRRKGATDLTKVIQDLSSAESGVVVFASSTGRQTSLEDEAWGNGAFTKALTEGLKGKADLEGKGKITISLLDYFICERVKELTNGRQTPVTAKPDTISDFPIAVPLNTEGVRAR